MLAVVVLHRLFECLERSVHLFAVGNIYLCGSRPYHNDARAAVFLLEGAYVLAQSLGHFPSCGAVFHVVAVKSFCVVLVKSSFHRHNFLKLIAYGFDVLLLKNLGVHSRLVGVLGVNIPCPEHNVVKRGKRHDVGIVQIFLLVAFTYANLVVLCH